MPHILPWLAYGTGDGGTAEVRIQARRTVYGSLKAEPGLRRDRCASSACAGLAGRQQRHHLRCLVWHHSPAVFVSVTLSQARDLSPTDRRCRRQPASCDDRRWDEWCL